MTFSIRTILVLVAIVALFLGAFFSRSEIFIAMTTVIGSAIILLSLALGIAESNPVRKTFWTGFFVLSLGTLICANYIDAYDKLVMQLVVPMRQTGEMAGTVSPVPWQPANLPVVPAPPSVQSLQKLQPYNQPTQPANYTQPIYYPTTLYTTNGNEMFALKSLVLVMFALVSGLLGGTASVWCLGGTRRSVSITESP